MRKVIVTLCVLFSLIAAQDFSFHYSPWEAQQARAELDYQLWRGSIVYAKFGMWNHFGDEKGAGLYFGLPVKVSLYQDILKAQASTNYGFGYLYHGDKLNKYANGQVNFVLHIKIGNTYYLTCCEEYSKDVYLDIGIGYTLFRYKYDDYKDVVSLFFGVSFMK